MTYQPYGQAGAPVPVRRQTYKTFGITYLSIRGIVLMIFLIVIMAAGAFIASMPASSSPGELGNSDMQDAELGIAVLVALMLAWAVYATAAGVMAIKGMIAGVIMGMVDAALTSLLGLISLFTGEFMGSMCWLVPGGAIIALGVQALRQKYGQPAPPYGAPPQQYGAPTQYAPQYAAPQAPYAPPQGYPAPQIPRPSGEVTSAVVPSPKMAALWILALAASVDRDTSAEALGRARTVAAQLLGPAAQARIQRQLAQPVRVMDVETDLVQHTMVLNQQANDAMKVNVIKAAEFVLKGPGGVEGLGQQFMATLKQQLGV